MRLICNPRRLVVLSWRLLACLSLACLGLAATPAAATPAAATPAAATPVAATAVGATPVVATPVVATPVVAADEAEPGAASTCTDSTHDYLSACGPVFTLPQWTDFSGWDKASTYSTIQLGRISGRPGAELLGRSSLGLWVDRFDAKLGQWTMLPTSEGGVNTFLPDYAGWDRAQYYATIQTADVDGDGQAKLLVRAASGLVTHKWNESSGHFDVVGSTLTALGDQNGWGRPAQYETIQTADLNGDRKAELLARAADGLHTYRWANGWIDTGTVLHLSDAGGWAGRQYYHTIHAADIDGDGKAELIARGGNGLNTWRWDNAKGWTDTGHILSALSDPLGWSEPRYYETIQMADINGDGKAELLARGADGLHTYHWSNGWQESGPVLGDLSNGAGFGENDRWQTIQTADLDGTKKAKLLARGPDGMIVWQWSGQRWERLASGTPALADNPWLQPRYARTIHTADIDGSGRAALVARGPYGMRTFVWNSQSLKFERPRAYAEFPPFSGEQEAAYNALGVMLLGAPSRDFRTATYADPTKTISDDLLSSYRQRLTERCKPVVVGAVNLPEPPRYIDCRPPDGSGVSTEPWTAVSNQIIAELWAASASTGYFGNLQQIQTELFQDQQGALPALAAELALPPPTRDVAPTYLNLARSGVELVTDVLQLFPSGRLADILAQAPQIVRSITTTAQGMGASAEGLGLDSRPSPATSYATITAEIARIQQQERTISEAQRRYVLADYGLLMTVGSEVHGQLLTLDKTAMLSAGRLSFAVWAYQLYLPAFWSRYEVTNCKLPSRTCNIPSGSNWRLTDGKNGNYIGIVPQAGSSCTRTVPVFPRWDCTWPSTGTLGDRLWGQISDSCKYDPTAGALGAWRYGCNIGANINDFFDRKNGWQLGRMLCDLKLGRFGEFCDPVS